MRSTQKTNPIVSTDKSKLDITLIHTFLTNSYWAKGRTKEEVILTIKNSRCYGIYLKKIQIGFARLVTDRYVFAYLMDVFISEPYRCQGYSKILMDAVLNDEYIKDVKQFYLKTKNAHAVYEKYNFALINDPEYWMRRNPIQVK